MSQTIGELKDFTDDIIGQLEKNEWISSYEVFHQSIDRIKLDLKYDYLNNRITQLKGTAIRLISKNKRLLELSISNSKIAELKNIPEPKSTHKKIPVTEFKQLKKPRITSIVGDEATSIDLESNFLADLKQKLNQLDGRGINDIKRTIDLLVERRIIVNTGSDIINDISLKVNYQVIYTKILNGLIYSSRRSYFGRNLVIDYISLENDVRKSLERKLQSSPKIKHNEIKGIILQPNVFGKLLASASYQYIIGRSEEINWQWQEEYQIYDDPHRPSGFSSIIFDDEGSLTKSTLMMENGRSQNKLLDLQSTGWKDGGSGFRNSWYQPLLRSYRYPIVRSFTNLSFYGGVGKGSKFKERNGILVEIVKGRASVFGYKDNPNYVIHSSEAYYWKNGVFLGPARNITITGSFNDLMQHATISSDQHLIVDKSIPGSIYTGYLYLQSGLANVRWN